MSCGLRHNTNIIIKNSLNNINAAHHAHPNALHHEGAAMTTDGEMPPVGQEGDGEEGGGRHHARSHENVGEEGKGMRRGEGTTTGRGKGGGTRGLGEGEEGGRAGTTGRGELAGGGRGMTIVMALMKGGLEGRRMGAGTARGESRRRGRGRGGTVQRKKRVKEGTTRTEGRKGCRCSSWFTTLHLMLHFVRTTFGWGGGGGVGGGFSLDIADGSIGFISKRALEEELEEGESEGEGGVAEGGVAAAQDSEEVIAYLQRFMSHPSKTYDTTFKPMDTGRTAQRPRRNFDRRAAALELSPARTLMATSTSPGVIMLVEMEAPPSGRPLHMRLSGRGESGQHFERLHEDDHGLAFTGKSRKSLRGPKMLVTRFADFVCVLLSALERVVVISAMSLLSGYDQGVIAVAMLTMRDDLSLNGVKEELSIGVMNLVAAIGGVGTGYLADKLGRKKAIAVAHYHHLSGERHQLMIGRIAQGIGVGISLVVPPVLIAELVPAHRRGWLVSVGDVCNNFGILLGYSSGLLFYGVSGAWRYMYFVGALPAALLLILIWTVPKSPRWLVRAGKDAKALRVFSLRGDAAATQRILLLTDNNDYQQKKKKKKKKKKQQKQQQ
ncbi:hypothetical protein T492DRAFT_849451 [Pavlovales sp. CCMP2436]|nr:hypothetical protein T492DRAFT_849451 [Pavlovales sp. CCMP2436]